MLGKGGDDLDDDAGADDDDDGAADDDDGEKLVRDPAVFYLVLDFYRTGRLHGREEVTLLLLLT